MPEAVIGTASQALIDNGVIGAVCILLMGALVWVVRTLRAEIKDERDAHQRTREEHLKDVRMLGSLGESVRDQLKVLELLINERDRR
ncbi:hypothetical protein SAMN06297251_102158 [Fulvimarina manganoxydans]|uniref:Uncharacterized protein n=1 Tax=Fulvimarina manganoxydans TaxID=937218 RepID=A0A1W1Z5Y5_9HYPH|nr:hypothetical protein [Fulvimarina manganoxydans]SMC43348.1 hypothetical protein SAMN06297251_102158 [Fulvimarina manganoxydans]